MMRFKNLSISGNLKKIIFSKLDNLFQSGAFINGPQINILEKNISKITKRKYAVAVGSGTAALILAVRLLNLKKGDEIILPCMSWISTANAVVLNGAKPVFADIQNDLNICTKSVEKLISKNVKAIIYVNFAGKMCDIDNLNKLSKKYKIPLIEDGSQSFGAKYKKIINGQNGLISAISLNPMKILGGIGESGIVLTNNKNYYNRLKIYRYSGMDRYGKCVYPSENFKIDTLQAIVINENLNHYKANILKRIKNANLVKSKLKNYLKFIDSKEKYKFDSYYVLIAMHPKRNLIIKEAKKKGIELKIHHYPLMSEMPFYKKNNFRKDIKNGYLISKKIFSIPFYEDLNNKNLLYVIETLKSILIKL